MKVIFYHFNCESAKQFALVVYFILFDFSQSAFIAHDFFHAQSAQLLLLGFASTCVSPFIVLFALELFYHSSLVFTSLD